MKAVVLAAGFGTRLGSLTAARAKPALMLGGRPMIGHVVANLAGCGFSDVAVNLHFLPEQIRDALGDGSSFGVSVTYFEEPTLLGTAGALVPMAGFLGDDPFVVHHADVVTDHDVGGMLRRHRDRGALLTMLVHRRAVSNSIVEVDENWRVRAFVERPTPEERRAFGSPWVNSGVYACSAGLLPLVPPPPSDLARQLLPKVLERGGLFAERLAGYRCAIDSPERLREAERALAEGRLVQRTR